MTKAKEFLQEKGFIRNTLTNQYNYVSCYNNSKIELSVVLTNFADQQNKALLKEVEDLRKGIKTVLENPTTKSEGENVKHIFDEEIKILEQLLNPNT